MFLFNFAIPKDIFLLLTIKKNTIMIVIAHFKIESCHFDTRRVVEEEVMGKKFTNLAELKKHVNNLKLVLKECWTIEEECIRQNDEIYATDSWVAYCFFEE